MANLSTLKGNTKLKVLVYGDSGTGKTCFASSFPGKVFIHDFDNKVESAANFWGTVAPEKLPEIDYEKYALGTVQERYARYYTWLTEAEKASNAGKLPWNTVVLDSLTLWSELLMKEIMGQNPAIKGPAPGVPGMQHYGVNSVFFKEQLGRLLNLDCNVVVTAHIDVTKDELTGEILRRPLVAGKLVAYLPIIFGEVYRSYAETKDGKTRYLAQTKTDSKFNCRSQLQGLPDHCELSYNALNKR